MATVAIDWDHTLMDGDRWLPGAKTLLMRLREEGHKIVVHSCNNPGWIKMNLMEAGIIVDSIWTESGKPVADLYIDDHAYVFPYNGDWTQELPKLLDRLKGLQ